MQTSRKMAYMMRDLTQYIMRPSLKYTRELGTYVSYDIAVYDCLEHTITATVPDVTTDRGLALHMVACFNRNQLDPCHLKDAIQDMLE